MWRCDLFDETFPPHLHTNLGVCFRSAGFQCGFLYDLNPSVNVLGIPVLVVGVSSAAAFNSWLLT